MIDITAHHINLSDFKYDLPEAKIAKFPLANRSQSKLLVYKKGEINHSQFSEVTNNIPPGATLFFNDTRVIPARLHFKKETGANIEIFLLEPILPTNNVAEAMLVKENCIWQCMVGNFKKWKDDTQLKMQLKIDGQQKTLVASISNREKQQISFKWEGNERFVDIVEAAGKVPLPPYINRDVQTEDHERYQTIYSNHEGAVAAPTAGLHFTDDILNQLKKNNITLEYLTLHVSAGTFQPIKDQNAFDHPMHAEQIVITLKILNTVLNSKKCIAVGTTSMRTLESTYWYGVKILLTHDTTFQIDKLFPYQFEESKLPTLKEAIEAVKEHMLTHNATQIHGHTEIFIFPGYQFKACQGLITNYHLPGSTLILLVAAFIGEGWKKVYDEALRENYRFLSYGDSSLLLP